VNVHLDKREGAERFLDTYRRVGIDPYKQAVYTS
jgi:sulfite reductase (NADPH) hemoprotein beta-component